MEKFDVVIVGAGVVGLAIAARLSHQYKHVLLIDKNNSFGEETSSRNSEVIHGGLYYPENSLKAKLCVRGKQLLYERCLRLNIEHKRIGKLLVAHNEEEENKLNLIEQQALKNGVHDLHWWTKRKTMLSEPNVQASRVLFSPSTGIINVHEYMLSLLVEFEQNGGLFVAKTISKHIEPCSEGFHVFIQSGNDEATISSQHVINSAGLHADKVAQQVHSLSRDLIPELHWCRGHYFSYSGKSPFTHLIYPVPTKIGLGIHASLDTAGDLKFGPDTQYVSTLNYQVDERLRDNFANAIRQYFPAMDISKLHPAYAGIRPKLQSEGEGFKDFVIQLPQHHNIPGLINLFGIDSPGLTSSLAIADYVAKAI